MGQGRGEIFPNIYLPTTGQVAPNDVAGLSNHFWGFLSNMVLGEFTISLFVAFNGSTPINWPCNEQNSGKLCEIKY
jgi:hypothetical protein